MVEASVELRAVDSGSLSVGSVCSAVDVKRLLVCPYLKKVLWGSSLDIDYSSMYLCSLDGSRCVSCGRNLKFRSRVGGFFTVFWVCPKFVLGGSCDHGGKP